MDKARILEICLFIAQSIGVLFLVSLITILFYTLIHWLNTDIFVDCGNTLKYCCCCLVQHHISCFEISGYLNNTSKDCVCYEQ